MQHDLRRVNAMNMKHAAKAVLISGLMVLGLGLVKEARAANPDTMVVTVTPSGVSYAVTISSPYAAGYNFDQVAIGATTISTMPIGVQNAGNISEYFSLAVVDTTGGGNAWTNSTAAANVTYVMQGLFNSAQPVSASFDGGTNNIPNAVSGTGASKWGQGTNKTAPLASQNLWLRLGMPSGVTENGQHTLMLSINGQAS
jgi:hypothetical protein